MVMYENLVILAMIISALWVVIGHTDRGLVKKYRNQIEDVYKQLSVALGDETLVGLYHTGKIDENKMDGF